MSQASWVWLLLLGTALAPHGYTNQAAERRPWHGHLDNAGTRAHFNVGATGFDAIVLREEAGRGLLTSQNRGKTPISVDNDFALAA